MGSSIREELSKHIVTVYRERADPKCPRCDGDMTLKVAKSGHYESSKFWGCDRWPQCTGKLSYKERGTKIRGT